MAGISFKDVYDAVSELEEYLNYLCEIDRKKKLRKKKLKSINEKI